MSLISRSALFAVLVSWCAVIAMAQGTNSRRMSIGDRLLLNRIVLLRQKRTQVMFVCDPSKLARILASVGRLDGAPKYIDRGIGYVRTEIPTEHLAELIADTRIDAYHISSSARTVWETDAPTRKSVEGSQRAFPIASIPESVPTLTKDLPILSLNLAQQANATADETTGVEQWLQDHPTYDGRGVTIAFIESALPEFSHPIFGPAKTLDGNDVSKLAAIINVLDPSIYDETLVKLTTELDSKSSWKWIGNRMFVLPRPGKYRFGILSVSAGDNFAQLFGVLRSQDTGEIWVDTDGDGDFRNELPVLGLEHKFEVRFLKISKPHKVDISFVLTCEKQDRVNIYLSRVSHQTMTVSVAAGSRTADSLAYGVAPAARIVLVRETTAQSGLSDFIEAHIAAARRADVDIVTSSLTVASLPDTDSDFVARVLSKLLHKYQKPIFEAAGNNDRLLATANSFGDAFSVGGSISPATFASFYGGARLPGMQVHTFSAAGPTLVGELKPDFLAPEERVAASTCTDTSNYKIPKNQPSGQLPICYRTSSGTSSAAPYAAGVAALLISAARQTGTNPSVENLGRALRASTQVLHDVPMHEQGRGLLNVGRAWTELQRTTMDPQILFIGKNHHAMTQYSNDGGIGSGLFEFEGWTTGSTGIRTLTLHRGAGPSTPITYRISWTGDDNTFSTQSSITLPLAKTVSLPISIRPTSSGVHSAILNVHDPQTDTILARSLVTMVVVDSLRPPKYSAQYKDHLPVMAAESHFFDVPSGTAFLSFDLRVTQGTIRTNIAPSNLVDLSYYEHKYPGSMRRILPVGTYRFIITNPSPGPWSVSTVNDSAAIREERRELVSTDVAQYEIRVRAFSVSLMPKASDNQNAIVIANNGTEVAEPELKQSWAIKTSHHGGFTSGGLPTPFDIQVPPYSSALIVNAHLSNGRNNATDVMKTVDLYLYDCTMGECFLHDFAIPAATEQQIVVRNPYPGHWVAMVGEPFFPGRGSYTIDAVIVAEMGSKTVSLGKALAPNETRKVLLDADNSDLIRKPSDANIRVYELFDEALEREEREHPWVTKTELDKLMTRPAAVGIAVLPLTSLIIPQSRHYESVPQHQPD